MGVLRVEVATEMSAFDALPPELQRLLRTAWLPYSALQLTQMLQAGISMSHLIYALWQNDQMAARALAEKRKKWTF